VNHVPDAAHVAQIVVEECGATPDAFLGFNQHWPCMEWRFVGALGFGGKVHATHGRVYVSCYPEDRTPAREAMIERANERLATAGQ